MLSTPRAAVLRSDFRYYLDLGFSDISSFACFLGEDYEELYGEPDISVFGELYRESKSNNT